MQDVNYDYMNTLERENWWYQSKRELFNKILTSLHRKFTSALDIGCGVGSHLGVLQKHAAHVEGIDFSPKAIEYCKQNGWKNIALGDVCNLKLKRKFDLVLCSELLEHVDDHKAIKEIANVMKPGGIFLFSVPAHKYLWNDNDYLSQHLRRYEKNELRELLSPYFEEVRMSYWNTTLFLPAFLMYKLMSLRQNREKTNNLNLVPKVLNRLLLGLMRVENRLFSVGLPQGISVVGVGRRRKG